MFYCLYLEGWPDVVDSSQSYSGGGGKNESRAEEETQAPSRGAARL